MAHHKASRIDSRRILIGLVALVVVVAGVATLLALNLRKHGAGEPMLPGNEASLGWQVTLPSGWRQVTAGPSSVRFLWEGLVVGGIDLLNFEDGDDRGESHLPDNAVVMWSWRAVSMWGWARVYDIAVPIEIHAEVSGLDGPFGLAPGDADQAPMRPETHCIFTSGGIRLRLWTRENAGFPPSAAQSAASSLLASLRPSGQEPQSRVAVSLISVKPTSGKGNSDTSLDVEASVTNFTVEPAHDIQVSLVIAGNYGAADLMPPRMETVTDLLPGQTVTLIATGVRPGKGSADYVARAGVQEGTGLEIALAENPAYSPVQR